MPNKIVRNSPDVGYLDPAFLAAAGVSQNVRANGFVHFSGVVSAQGAGEALVPDDVRSQTENVIAILARLLAAEELDFSDLVSITVFTTDMPALVANVDVFSAAFAAHPPASTWIGVATLANPALKLEVMAVAACRLT